MNPNYKISPKGTAIFPNLRKPEMFNSKEVGYTVKLKVSEEIAYKFKDILLQEIEEQKKNDPTLANKNFEDPIIPIDQDKNGNWLVKFKSKTEFKNKKGEIIHRSIPIYDASTKLLDESIDVGYGSTIKIAYKPYVYYLNNKMYGIKLLIEAVQVINLVEKKQEKTASDYGFSNEADPFN